MKWMPGYRFGAAGLAMAAVIAVAPPASAVRANVALAAGLPSAGRSWGSGTPVHGLSRLNAGGNAEVDDVSCASAGNCLAGGSYSDAKDHIQAFVSSEQNGKWASAIEVPGTARLNTGGNAEVDDVSCASAGNCLAGGSYSDSQNNTHAFVASERNGKWSTAIRVPGTVAPGTKGSSWLDSVSCASAGNCAAAVANAPGSSLGEAFVASERNGKWSAAVKVAGTGTGVAAVNWVSCGSAVNCVGGGFYTDSQGHSQAFVTTERDGKWGAAVNVLASSGLNAGGNAFINSVSCASAGNCAVGGTYKDGQGHFHVFVAGERSGRWGTAIEIPGTAQLNAGGLPQVTAVSCASAGNCAVGGWYLDSSGNRHAFVAAERSGTWGTAIELPGTKAHYWVDSVSCASAGDCAASGGYVDSSGNDQGFVDSQRNGTWGTAAEAPARLNVEDNAETGSVSCGSAGYCVAGGYYTDAFFRIQGFVVTGP